MTDGLEQQAAGAVKSLEGDLFTTPPINTGQAGSGDFLSQLTTPAASFIGTPGLPGTGNPNLTEGTKSIPGFLAEGASSLEEGASSLLGNLIPSDSAFSAANSLLNPLGSAIGAATGITSTNSEISDFFLRAVVIILGFIFVAVGLSMFKTSDIKIVGNPLEGVKKSLKG